MESSNAAASTLTRQRLGFAVLSLAATATASYFVYRIVYPTLPEPESPQLRRRNAVRHRRNSLTEGPHHRRNRNRDRDRDRDPNPVPEPDHDQASDASSTTLDESHHGDENAELGDVNTVRPLTDGETVAEDNVLDDNWYDATEPFAQNHQRAGQNIVSLLFKVSEDNAHRNAYVHRGCQCNACGILPIRGIRYRCANCADFDLCETCESQGLHTRTHIFYKIKVPAPRLGPRQMQPVWYPGDPESCQKYLPRQLMAKLSKETGFERPELEALWEQWTFMASTEWREDPDDLCLAMDRKTFERYLVPSGGYRHTAPNLLHDRIFAFYDTNNDDLIGFSEFLKGTAYRKRKDRLRKIFDGYDIDRDGYVNRRDFLRLFRAYYVLFNQMHRDILEGLDDQVMSSTEAHQLITSRQPLSSLFGREGGFPQADAGRPIEGKVVNVTTGDVSISDGKNRAVVEDRPDTEDRESMLTSLFSRQPHRHHDHNEPDHNSIVLGGPPSFLAESQIQMLTALLNPPTDVGELPALLVNGRREDDELMVMVNALNGQAESSDESGEDIAGDENRPDGGDNENADGQGQQAESPSGRGPSISYEGFITRGDSESDLPSGTQIREAYRRNPRLLSNSRIRANARRKLLERWKRRQFYLDEEEGALPPDGWEDDADVLQSLNGATENSNSAQPPVLSPRSRSSSKVRFAEDADDYETRSNPSTSSRSIPERWGGMDIPDAEKDAGKEIFYQVMQQAFNEILDILFKKKEDLAVKAAETKEDRDRYRSFFKDLDPTLEDRLAKHKAARQGEKTTTASQPRSRDEEGNIFAEMALPDLLSASGYSVDGTTQVDDEANEEVDAAGESADAGETEDTQPADESLSGQEDGGYRDPTMPQFRPNSWPTRSSEPDLIQPKLAPTSEKKASSSRNGKEPRDNVPAKEESATVSSENSSSSEKRGPDENRDSFDRQQLVEWKRLDLAEEEAKTRGGWGRLSYEEFEQIYRNEESRNSRLDYLGTWIDFCIPYH